jgi:hypothetical protein
VLTQAAPSDTLYVTPSTRPVLGGDFVNLTSTVDKTLTERFGIGIQDGYTVSGGRRLDTGRLTETFS